jgi:hypothetical protein
MNAPVNIEKKDGISFSVKKCHSCNTPLTLDAKICYSCKRKVGKVDRHGIASKPTDWKGYTICIISWVIFIVYVIWAFF